jgi:acyl-CoA synthetase (AMP-forming)/AMP-acid ligase II
MRTVGRSEILEADGFPYLVDHKKDMIDSGGINKVYPRDIDETAARHPAMREPRAPSW